MSVSMTLAENEIEKRHNNLIMQGVSFRQDIYEVIAPPSPPLLLAHLLLWSLSFCSTGVSPYLSNANESANGIRNYYITMSARVHYILKFSVSKTWPATRLAWLHNDHYYTTISTCDLDVLKYSVPKTLARPATRIDDYITITITQKSLLVTLMRT